MGAAAGSIASLGTVAVEDSLLVEAVKTFSSSASSSAGSRPGGAWLPVAAMSYFINLKIDSLKTALGSEVDSKVQRSFEELGAIQQSLLLDEVDVTLDVSAELPFILLDNVPTRLLGLNAEGTFSLRPRKAASKQIELAYVYKKAAKVWTIPSPAGKVFQRRINCGLTRSWSGDKDVGNQQTIKLTFMRPLEDDPDSQSPAT